MRYLIITAKVFMWSVLLMLTTVLFYKVFPAATTPLMVLRSIEQSMNGQKLMLKKEWVSLDQISPYLPLAVVCSEDQKFLKHKGFDWQAMKAAQEYNARHKKRKIGGSTISQQTAKNVFLYPARNYIRKGMEFVFTFSIEYLWGKRKIMEHYLNDIEMGDGIYGAEAAAQEYFHKHASALTREECALLAGCLPNPFIFNPGKPSKRLLTRQQRILKQMSNWGNRLDWSGGQVEDDSEEDDSGDEE